MEEGNSKKRVVEAVEEDGLRKSRVLISIEDGTDDLKSFFTWVFLDQSNLWRAALSWSIFSLLAIAVPLLSHFVFHCNTCDQNHRRPFDFIVQSSLSFFSVLSFISLSSFSRKYGIRRFLFLDKLCNVSDKVQRGYALQLHASLRLLFSFILPCFAADCVYKIWWFTSGSDQIPYFINSYLSHTVACFLLLSSWLYRTSIFFLVCVLFRLICYLQILRLEDFAQVFHNESDIGFILLEHLRVQRNLRIISHRFRAFILSALILVTASQLASLLVTTENGSEVNIFTAGELALTSMTLVAGLFICLRSAAKITHRAQAITCLAAKWHACSTVNSFDDVDNETPRNQMVSPVQDMINVDWGSDHEVGDEDDEIDNTSMMPVYSQTISYQKRQALVTYFENTKAGITVFGFMLDRTSLHMIFAIQMSLTLWLLNRTIDCDESSTNFFDKQISSQPTILDRVEDIERVIDLNTIPSDIDEDYSGEEDSTFEANSESPMLFDLNVSPEAEISRKKYKYLTDDERRAIFQILLKESNNGRLKRTLSKSIAAKFSVSTRTVQRIWLRGKQGVREDMLANISTSKKNCGRKRVQIDPNQFQTIPLRRRSTMRSIAKNLNLSIAAVHRNFKRGKIRRHSNAIKPQLTEENKKARLEFCLSMIDENSTSENPKFKDMYNTVHVDEKLFYMTKQNAKYYLLPEESEPLRTCKSKHHITKVMFLTATARPRYDEDGNETFSGKIGIFPFIVKEPAKRSSKNRAAGTEVTKPILSINKEVMRSFIIEKLLPAIREKWPRSDCRSPIYIQQDNAKPHISPRDREFLEAAQIDGFDIRLTCQPANSPDLNVLDLGVFSAIQALQHQQNAGTVDELINVVQQSFYDFPTKKLNYIFLSLQMCMIEIMKVHGSNRYKLPHGRKETLERNNNLPNTLQVCPMLLDEVRAFIRSSGSASTSNGLN